MNVILCIVLITGVIFLFFALYAFGLQAARAVLPKYEVPPAAYSFQIDRETDDIERCVAKSASPGGKPHPHILVVNMTNGQVAFCASDSPGGRTIKPPLSRDDGRSTSPGL